MKMIGIKDALTKQKLNVGYAAWSLVTGATVAFIVTRFKRRTLYMWCTLSLLVVYTGWTIAFKFATTADKAGGHNGGASAASAFFIFAYQPCYNIGFNALTYSMPPPSIFPSSPLFYLRTSMPGCYVGTA